MDTNPYKKTAEPHTLENTSPNKILVIALSHDNRIKRITSRELEKYKNHYFANSYGGWQHPLRSRTGNTYITREQEEHMQLEWHHNSVKKLTLVDVRDELMFFCNTGNIFTIPGEDFRANLKRNIPYRCNQLFPLKHQEYIVEIIGVPNEPRSLPSTHTVGRYTHLVFGSARGKLGLINVYDLIKLVHRNQDHNPSWATEAKLSNSLSVSWEGHDELVSARPCLLNSDWIICRVTNQGRRDQHFVDHVGTYRYDSNPNPLNLWQMAPLEMFSIPDGDKVCAVAAGHENDYLHLTRTDGISTTSYMNIRNLEGSHRGPINHQRKVTPKNTIITGIEISPKHESYINFPDWYVFSDLGQPQKKNYLAQRKPTIE